MNLFKYYKIKEKRSYLLTVNNEILKRIITNGDICWLINNTITWEIVENYSVFELEYQKLIRCIKLERILE